MWDWIVETFATFVQQFKGKARESRKPRLRSALILVATLLVLWRFLPI